jgi:Tfp pilus assembly protein PilO
MAIGHTLRELFKKIKTRFSGLEKRQKILVSLLIFTILLSLYFNKLLKPQLKRLSRLNSELVELNQQISNLNAQMPDIEKEKTDLEELKRKNKQLKERLVSLEKELPESYRIPQLLGELAKQTQGLAIDFSYIKPKATSGALEDEYTRFDIEMQFNAPYRDFRSYLVQLEHLSAYLNITDIVVEETKEGSFASETTATMVLSSLLNKGLPSPGVPAGESKEETLLAKDTLERNPFLPSSKEVSKYLRRSKYVLSGITFAGSKSTAIINNEVYRIGDLLEKKYPIKQILPNMVIISHGKQTEILMLE